MLECSEREDTERGKRRSRRAMSIERSEGRNGDRGEERDGDGDGIQLSFFIYFY